MEGEELNIVAVLDRETLTARHVEVLDRAYAAKPDYALDTFRRRLYLGHLSTAELEIFDIGPLP